MFEAVGSYKANIINDEELKYYENNVCLAVALVQVCIQQIL